MNDQIKTILDSVEVGALATVNTNRTPLITPLHFARMGDAIIWISDPEAKHSQNAYRAGKVEFVVWGSDKKAVFLRTFASELPKSQQQQAMDVYRKKLGNFIPQVEKTQFYIAPIGNIDEKSTTEDWWHCIA